MRFRNFSPTSARFLSQGGFEEPQHQHVPESPCPHCGKVNDASMGSAGTRPRPDDYGLCAGCGKWNQYGAELQLVKATFDGLTPDERARMKRISQVAQKACNRRN